MHVAARLVAGVVGAALAFVLVAACLPAKHDGSGGQARQTSVMPTYAAPVTPPSSVTSAPKPAQSAKPSQTNPAKAVLQKVAAAAPTWLVITTTQGKTVLQTAVDQQTAPVNPDGTWGKMDPPAWNRAVWETQSVQPGYPSSGTSAIYGHACHHHDCSFDRLISVRKGDMVTLTTPKGVLTYRVNQPVQYPKEGNASLSSKQSVPNELMLVTCAYEQGDESLNNLVVTATLVSAVLR